MTSSIKKVHMNIHFQDLIPEDFDDNSRVWVYQSNRQFSISEAVQIEEQLENFSKEWNSHGSLLKTYANLFFGQFIVIMVDETHVKVGGCSTDASLRFIKNLEEDYNIQLLDRQLLAFIIKEKVQLIPLSIVNSSIESDSVTADTLYFNNLVLNKAELENDWIIPIKESWLIKKTGTTV